MVANFLTASTFNTICVIHITHQSFTYIAWELQSKIRQASKPITCYVFTEIVGQSVA